MNLSDLIEQFLTARERLEWAMGKSTRSITECDQLNEDLFSAKEALDNWRPIHESDSN
jgi:hypothetical protein